jgi:hypothetical protein
MVYSLAVTKAVSILLALIILAGDRTDSFHSPLGTNPRYPPLPFPSVYLFNIVQWTK